MENVKRHKVLMQGLELVKTTLHMYPEVELSLEKMSLTRKALSEVLSQSSISEHDKVQILMKTAKRIEKTKQQIEMIKNTRKRV